MSVIKGRVAMAPEAYGAPLAATKFDRRHTDLVAISQELQAIKIQVTLAPLSTVAPFFKNHYRLAYRSIARSRYRGRRHRAESC